MERKVTRWVIVGALTLSIACSGVDVHQDDVVTATTQPTPSPVSSLVPVGITPSVAMSAGTSTDVPQPLPTNTEEPTPRPTTAPTVAPEPPATATAIATSVPSTPRPTPAPTTTLPGRQGILSFAVTPKTVERGGTVTLAWDTIRVGGVSITRLSEDGGIFLETEALDLAATGSLTLEVPEHYVESVTYYLGAHSASGAIYKALSP